MPGSAIICKRTLIKNNKKRTSIFAIIFAIIVGVISIGLAIALLVFKIFKKVNFYNECYLFNVNSSLVICMARKVLKQPSFLTRFFLQLALSIELGV